MERLDSAVPAGGWIRGSRHAHDCQSKDVRRCDPGICVSPESKCADSEGNVCDKETIGLLQRRHIQIGYVKGIGKETNNLDDVEAGVLHSEDKVYTDYTDPRHDEWETIIRPIHFVWRASLTSRPGGSVPKL